MLAAVIYVIAVLLANLTATLFLPVPIFPGTEALVSVGTLIFGITFTQRDRMHYKGRPFVYKVILFAAFLNLLMLVSFSYLWGPVLVGFFENRQWDWLASSAAMLAANGWRVFLASFLATVIAEAADTEVYHYFRERSWIGRVFRSNAVSIPIDSILFNLIAFAGSAFFPPPVLIRVIIGEIISKYVVGIGYALLVPWTWREQPKLSGGSRAT